MLNDKRIKSCVSRFASGAYSRLQFLRAVSQSVGAHTEALQPLADSSSSSSSSSSSEDEDEASQTPAATTSAASESATAAAASTSDDCSQVCCVAPLVPCGHALFCESCAMRVSDTAAGCFLCRADIAMVMRICSLDNKLCSVQQEIVHLCLIWCACLGLAMSSFASQSPQFWWSRDFSVPLIGCCPIFKILQ